MTSYPPIYDGNPPSERGSDTSQAAAQSVKESSGKTRKRVLRAIQAYNGCTDDEVEVITGMRHQSASARRRELVLLGAVVDSGKRRATRSGRSATVWVVAE